jgi:hypothetical protein
MHPSCIVGEVSEVLPALVPIQQGLFLLTFGVLRK